MTLRELYEEALLGNFHWLQMLIEFVVFEKGKETGLTLDSDKSELDIYFLEKNRKRMNRLLIEYSNKIGGHDN